MIHSDIRFSVTSSRYLGGSQSCRPAPAGKAYRSVDEATPDPLPVIRNICLAKLAKITYNPPMSDTPQQQQPDPIQQLTHHAYYQLVHTLCALLPPPLADTPEALLARNDAAIAKVAALLPVNADEDDLAVHCVCARAQAEDVVRLSRVHAADIHLVMKLNAQFALMERTALSIRAQLLRVQTVRLKREANGAAANANDWTRYLVARQMRQALDQGLPPAVPAEAHVVPALSGEPPPPAPAPEPVAPPPAQVLPAAPPPAEAAQLPLSPPATASPSAPARVAAPPRRHTHAAADTGEPQRDLAAEADHYACVYPRRARSIRQHGGLPPDCDFGPPDDDLIRAIVTGTSPALRALDSPATTAA